MSKTVMPRDRRANLRLNSKTDRWDYNVRLVREDGSVFRRAGSAIEEAEARRKRDIAYAEFNRDAGAAKDSKRAARREKTDTLSGWFDRCVEEFWQHEMADTSRDAYFYCIRKHVLPKFGQTPIAEITVPVLQDLANGLWEDGQRSAARQVRSSMSALMATAVRQGVIASNPATAVAIRNHRRREVEDEVSAERRRLVGEDEIKALLGAAEGTCMYLPILLGARMGLRISEALGLDAKHVDLAKGLLHVRQQLQWVRGEGNKVVPPKSRSSIRTLPIPPSLVPALSSAVEEGGLLCKKEGGPMPAKKHSRYMHLACVKAGLDTEKPYPTHHNLRGSYLSHMANVRNARPQELMALAGHGDIQTTMRYYVQASNADLMALVADI